MTTRDRDPRTVAKLYEDCRERAPITIDRLRAAVGISHPEFSEFGKRCMVVNQFLCGNPALEKKCSSNSGYGDPNREQVAQWSNSEDARASFTRKGN